jgi:hypothetical protein
MAYHRRSVVKALFNPPLGNSSFHDMRKDGRIPPPDAMNGRVPLWSDESLALIIKNLEAAASPRRTAGRSRRGLKRAAAGETSPTT